MPSLTAMQTAIDFIKESLLYKEAPKWIAPAFDVIVSKQFIKEDFEKAIKQITGGKSGPKRSDSGTDAEDIEGADTYDIKRITSLKEVSNAGLLSSETPITFKGGLNIFYGKNGSGKSSIYNCLCKALGKDCREIYPNLATDNQEESSCLVTYIGLSDDEEKEITWNTGTTCTPSSCAIFDSSISNVLVDEDQDNNFTIAHLGVERFSYLHDLYDQVGDELSRQKSVDEEKLASTQEVIEGDTPFVLTELDDTGKIKRSFLDLKPLSKAEKERLNKNINQIKILEKGNTEATIKNLRNAKRIVNDTLSVLRDEKGGDKFKDIFFREVNQNIIYLTEAQKLYKEKGLAKLMKLLPPDWINSFYWKEFINKGQDFVDSLSSTEAKRYSEDSCPYCRQELDSTDSKQLIREYSELKKKHENPRAPFIIKNQNYIEELNTAIASIESLSVEMVDIQSEIKMIKKVLSKDKLDRVVDFLKKERANLESFKKMSSDRNSQNLIANLIVDLSGIDAEFANQIEGLDKSVSEKTKKISKLTSEIDPLINREEVVKNKKHIKAFNTLKDGLRAIELRNGDLTNLKRKTSLLESRFSEQATLKQFKDRLVEEYKSLNFTPPTFWSIKTKTPDGVNKRVYALGDRRLSEIFSDGEKKIHALADFLAESSLRGGNNVYIFDDPVNSLDEDYIEYVAKRLKKLAKDGNQVLVFTHNIFFLNDLIAGLSGKDKKVNKVEKLGTEIHIDKDIIIGGESDLKKDFDKMRSGVETLKSTVGSVDPDRIGDVYCVMSRYLESYTGIRLLGDVIGKFRSNVRMESLINITESITKERVEEISELYRSTNRRCNRHSQPDPVPDPTLADLERDYKELITKFKYS